MVYWLDIDLKGNTSIRPQIESGLVTELRCPTFEAYQNHCRALIPRVTVEDLVIVDTVTSLLEMCRTDAALGTDPDGDLWAKRGKFIEGDKAYLNYFRMAASLTLRWMKNLSSRGCRIIAVCHEDDILDETVVPATRRRGPMVNPAMVGLLSGSASDIYRLEALIEPMTRQNAETGEFETIAKPDDRILWLRRQPHFVAKYSCDIERSPKILQGLINPTLPKVYEHLGVRPPFMVLYGPNGCGKTTLSVSEVIVGDSPKI